MTQRTILLTGFEPFGGDPINPSWWVAQALDGERVSVSRRGCLHPEQAGTYRIRSRQLPCAFDEAIRALNAAVDELKPSLVLSLGLAAGREAISIERVALNLIDARIPDNVGMQPIDQPVLKRVRQPAYFSNLPVKAMRRAAQAQGVEARLSMSAGGYVCNAIFFALMHRVTQIRKRDGRLMLGGFVHLPCVPEQMSHHEFGRSVTTVPLDEMVTGIRAMLPAAFLAPRDREEAGGHIA